jgi:hypothetical protein
MSLYEKTVYPRLAERPQRISRSENPSLQLKYSEVLSSRHVNSMAAVFLKDDPLYVTA